MLRLRSLLIISTRAKSIMTRIQTPMNIQKTGYHAEGPILPFDNMPFPRPNRYVATLFFTVFIGSGLWAPFIILWYSMAKRTL